MLRSFKVLALACLLSLSAGLAVIGLSAAVPLVILAPAVLLPPAIVAADRLVAGGAVRAWRGVCCPRCGTPMTAGVKPHQIDDDL